MIESGVLEKKNVFSLDILNFSTIFAPKTGLKFFNYFWQDDFLQRRDPGVEQGPGAIIRRSSARRGHQLLAVPEQRVVVRPLDAALPLHRPGSVPLEHALCAPREVPTPLRNLREPPAFLPVVGREVEEGVPVLRPFRYGWCKARASNLAP